MERLIAVRFWLCNVVFNAAWEWRVESVQDAKNGIAIGDISHHHAHRHDVVHFAHVIFVLEQLAVQTVAVLHAAVDIHIAHIVTQELVAYFFHCAIKRRAELFHTLLQ